MNYTSLFPIKRRVACICCAIETNDDSVQIVCAIRIYVQPQCCQLNTALQVVVALVFVPEVDDQADLGALHDPAVPSPPAVDPRKSPSYSTSPLILPILTAILRMLPFTSLHAFVNK